MQVLDLSKVGELVIKVLLTGLLVNVGDNDDPALDRSDGGRIAVRGHGGIGGAIVVLGIFGGEGRVDVDVHFSVCHDVGIVEELVRVRWFGTEVREAGCRRSRCGEL
jgi:hypothetical protein